MFRLAGTLAAVEFTRGAMLIILVPFLVTVVLHQSLDVAAFAISAHYFVDTVLRTPSGWVIDRTGTRGPLVAGIVLGVFTVTALALFSMQMPLWVVTGVFGIGTAPLWPSVVTTTSDHGSDDRGGRLGSVFAGWLVGAGLGPVVLNLVLKRNLIDAFAVLIGGQVVALLLALLTPNRQPHRVSSKRASLAIVQSVRRLFVLFPGMFAQTMVLGVLMPIASVYIRRVLGLTGFGFDKLLFLGGGIAVLAMVPMGRLSDRLGVRLPLTAGFGLVGFGLLIFPAVRSFYSVVLLAGLIGTAYALLLPAWNNFLASVIPSEAAGSMWGIFMSVEGLGLTVGPLLGAQAWDRVGPVGPFWLGGLILVVMATFYGLYPLQRLMHPLPTR